MKNQAIKYQQHPRPNMSQSSHPKSSSSSEARQEDRSDHSGSRGSNSLLQSFEEALSHEDIMECILGVESLGNLEWLQNDLIGEILTSAPGAMAKSVDKESGNEQEHETVAGPSRQRHVDEAHKYEHKEGETSSRTFVDVDLVDIVSKYLSDENQNSVKSIKHQSFCDVASMVDKSEASGSTKSGPGGRLKNDGIAPEEEGPISIYLEHVQKEPFSSVLGEQCKLCPDRCFYRRHDLLTHIRNTHLRQRPFGCDLCAAKFKRKAHLEGHMNAVHERSTRYVCKYCQKVYSSDSSRRKHIRDIHHTELY